jgi:rhodanese-related sulfurtransferase
MVKEVSIEELKEKIDQAKKFYLVDAREKEKYEHNHITEALGIAWGPGFEEKIKHVLPDKDAEIVVYGANEVCEQAKNAAKFLDKSGYTNVSLFSPGITGWMEAGLRLEFGRES